MTLPPCSSLDRTYHRHHHRQRRGASGASGGGGGGVEGEREDETGVVREQGRLWRCYGELERLRRRREAKRRTMAEEARRAMTRMAFMGRRSRAPYHPAGMLPRGPYHAPGPGTLVFPEYDWGPGVGGDAASADVSPLSPPSSIWGRGGWSSPLRGWGRGGWRR